MNVIAVDTIGIFNYSKDNLIKLTIPGKILWPWGTGNPTDQKTCVDDDYECPEEDLNGTFPPDSCLCCRGV